jgi:subtilisin family serine protease
MRNKFRAAGKNVSGSSLNGNRKSIRTGLAYELLENRAMLASYVPGEVLVQFEPNTEISHREAIRDFVGAELVEPIHTKMMIAEGQGVMERISLHPGVNVQKALATISRLPGVRFAEPNWIYSTTEVSNDTNYASGSLWGMYSDDSPTAAGPNGTTNQFGSQAEEAWLAGHVGSNDIYVGVIDEGIQVAHPDLAANIWANPFDPVDGVDNDGNGKIDDTNGWDFVNDDRTVYDGTDDNHGTHVAGTIGAKGGNGIGVAGVNWNVKMISAKFLGASGGTTSNAILSVDYLTDLKVRHGLNIVATSNSWGGGGFSQGLLDAITRGANRGILFVAAAGNSNSNNESTAWYPGNYNTTAGAGFDAVISVASITSSGAKSSFSSYGATTVDLGAPGSSISSTVPSNSYASYSGTSMATPHVSGAVALFAASNPSVSAQQLRTQLLSNTTLTASMTGITATGGRLDVRKMLAAPLPSLTINDITLSEGNSGTLVANLTVSLSASLTNSVTVNYATANGSASAGSDYTSTNGTLTFSAGQTSKTISVTVQGDTSDESDESLFVNLSAPVNASIVDGSGMITIVNDDSPPPIIVSVTDANAFENQKRISFLISLSAAGTSAVTVSYATNNGLALGGFDYASQNNLLSFAPGEIVKTVLVELQDDKKFEGNEDFFVELSTATGAIIGDGQGEGVIIDDESDRPSTFSLDRAAIRPDGFARDLVSWWNEFDREGAESKAPLRRSRR